MQRRRRGGLETISENQTVRRIHIANGCAKWVPGPSVLKFRVARERGIRGDALLLESLIDVDDSDTRRLQRHVRERVSHAIAQVQNRSDRDRVGFDNVSERSAARRGIRNGGRLQLGILRTLQFLLLCCNDVIGDGAGAAVAAGDFGDQQREF